MGRPLKKIESPPPGQLIEELAGIGATWDEMAEVMGENKSTLQRRFAAPYKTGRHEFKMCIRRQQFDLMKKGNVAMAIWLGKQYLGQRDKSDVNTNATVDIKKDIKDKTPVQREEYIKALQGRVLEAAKN